MRGQAPYLIDVRCGQTAHDAIFALHLITEPINCYRAHYSFGQITTAQRGRMSLKQRATYPFVFGSDGPTYPATHGLRQSNF
jgi:hypothetical protein